MITQVEVDEHFKDFAALLESHQVDGGDGAHRFADAGEFMLMQVTPEGYVHFKHRDSRNYIFMDVSGTQLHIPRGRPFCQGVFPAPTPLPVTVRVLPPLQIEHQG